MPCYIIKDVYELRIYASAYIEGTHSKSDSNLVHDNHLVRSYLIINIQLADGDTSLASLMEWYFDDTCYLNGSLHSKYD